MATLKSEIQSQLVRAAYHLERACSKRWRDSYDENRPRDNERSYSELWEAIDRMERSHMRLGRRMLGDSPKRVSSHNTRVCYFVVKLLVTENLEAMNPLDVLDMRDDWRIAYGIQRSLGRGSLRRMLQDAGIDLYFIDAIDYSEHLAGN